METKRIQDRISAQAALIKMGTIGVPVQLIEFRILKRSYEISPRIEVPGSVQLQTGQGFDVLNENIQVSTEFRTVLSPKNFDGKATDNLSLSVSQSIGVSYLFPETADMDARIIFALIGGVMTAWPYWRTFVHSSTAEAGMHVRFAPLIQPLEAAGMAGFRDQTAAS